MPNESTAKDNSAMGTIERRLQTRILTRGRIVVIGLGGVGSILIQNLIVFLASLAGRRPLRVVLCDGDAFTPANAYRTDVPEFTNKAAAWVNELCRKFAGPGLVIRSFPHYITRENQSQVIQDGDVCLLCCDNHATRKLVSDRVRECRNAVLISGGNDGVTRRESGTCGNVQVYVRSAGRDLCGAPLDQFHPEIANPADRNPDDLDCLELAVAGEPQLGFANLAVASAMCNALLRLLMTPKTDRIYDEVCFDILAGSSVPQCLTAPPNAARGNPVPRVLNSQRSRRIPTRSASEDVRHQPRRMK
jgi:predicted ThiF/HesA family dinucleotide-utilizing enzyme